MKIYSVIMWRDNGTSIYPIVKLCAQLKEEGNKGNERKRTVEHQYDCLSGRIRELE